MTRSLQNQIQWCARAQWILAALIVAMGAGFYLFEYRPTTQQRADLHIQIESKQNELHANKSRTDGMKALEFRVVNLESTLKRFDQKLPKQADLGQFFKEITQISQSASLRDWDATHGSPVRSDLYGELPIKLKFQGEFMNVVSFLRQVEQMERLTRVREINIKGTDPKHGQVEVELTMNIYFAEG